MISRKQMVEMRARSERIRAEVHAEERAKIRRYDDATLTALSVLHGGKSDQAKWAAAELRRRRKAGGLVGP